MKRWNALLLGFLVLVTFAFSACDPNDAEEDVTVSFNLTDAPVAGDAIKAVRVSFAGLKINESGTALEADSTWIDVPIDPAVEYDLLSLSEGATALLGNVSLTAGTQVNQIRFLEPTIEVVESDDSVHACTLASATGLKIVNAFDVPLSGTLALTVDFDVRKSLVLVGGASPEYRMKPTLRAIVENEAGSIGGAIPEGYAVYAYADGTYDESAGDPADDSSSPEFDDAYSSALAKDSDGDAAFTYTLAFLEAGTYDLVVVQDGATTATTTIADVVVASGAKTTRDIAIP